MLTKQKAEEILGKGRRSFRYSPDKFAEYFLHAYQLLAGGKVKLSEYDEVRSLGWCQGAYARTKKGYRVESGKSKHAAQFCALGALERATPEWSQFKVARTLLGQALGATPAARWTIASVNDGPDKAAAKQAIMDGYRQVQAVLAELE